MRRTLLMALATLAVLATVTVARAGLYIPSEEPDLVVSPESVQPLPFDVFRLKFQNVISIAIPAGTELRDGVYVARPESDLRRHYLKKQADLLERGIEKVRLERLLGLKISETLFGDGLRHLAFEEYFHVKTREHHFALAVEGLTVSDLVSLSGYLIRMRSSEHGNQATYVLHAALKRDPRNFQIQSNLALLYHLHGRPDAPQTQLDAIQLRPREIPGMNQAQTAFMMRVERALFDVQKARLRERKEKGERMPVETVDDLFKVAFVGDGGAYEAGGIATAEKAKLPADAIAVVQQLLFWTPEDTRLYWLLAELYNAAGDLQAAGTIFDECVNARQFKPEALRDHRRAVNDAIAARQPPPPDESKNWRNHPEAFWIVGGVIAVPFLLLVYWQWRELRRRFGHDCSTHR